ncbi:MAG: ABC transporter ATP-binding protein [Thermoplasmata archaeon]|nr:MAG: ABC transporter ATP-binding protein [Thermoplasmata archaeon]
MSIIETFGLTKRFDSFTAVDNVSFNVEEGEIFGFLGPNGAGKTTTIKMLTTLLNPTKGYATIAGYSIIDNRDEVRKSIGVVFQDPALDTELTGRENLDYHARIYGISRVEREKRISEVLALVDLEEKKDVLVKYYSGGMKRRLEIARGLMHHPKVLFLDEPTLGLDSQTRRAIWDYIREMNKTEGTTIFLTTHYMEEADSLCDRVGIIDHGKILVVDKPRVLKNMVGNDIIKIVSNNNSKLSEVLKDLDWVENCEEHEDTIIIGVEKGDEKIPMVFDIARKHDIRINSINLNKPTLDDVFLHYTGRMIREEESSTNFIPPRFHRGVR